VRPKATSTSPTRWQRRSAGRWTLGTGARRRLYHGRIAPTPSGKARARKDVEQALGHGRSSLVTDPSPELVRLVRTDQHGPRLGGLGPRFEHGAEVFRRYGSELYPYFGIMTFNAYGLETIATPLANDRAYTRRSRSADFWKPLAFGRIPPEPGAMRPGGMGRRSAIMVRVLHSIHPPHAAAPTPSGTATASGCRSASSECSGHCCSQFIRPPVNS